MAIAEFVCKARTVTVALLLAVPFVASAQYENTTDWDVDVLVDRFTAPHHPTEDDRMLLCEFMRLKPDRVLWNYKRANGESRSWMLEAFGLFGGKINTEFFDVVLHDPGAPNREMGVQLLRPHNSISTDFCEQQLLRLSKDPSSQVRRAVALKQSYVGNISFIRRTLIRDKSPEVRIFAALRLAQDGDQCGLSALAETGEYSEILFPVSKGSISEETEITSVIQHIGLKMEPHLARHLRSKSQAARSWSLVHLMLIGSPNLQTYGLAQIHQRYNWLRATAYFCIASNRDPKVIPLLIKGLDDPDVQVRGNVREALKHGDPVRGNETVWKEGVAALEKYEKRKKAVNNGST